MHMMRTTCIPRTVLCIQAEFQQKKQTSISSRTLAPRWVLGRRLQIPLSESSEELLCRVEWSILSQRSFVLIAERVSVGKMLLSSFGLSATHDAGANHHESIASTPFWTLVHERIEVAFQLIDPPLRVC